MDCSHRVCLPHSEYLVRAWGGLSLNILHHHSCLTCHGNLWGAAFLPPTTLLTLAPSPCTTITRTRRSGPSMCMALPPTGPPLATAPVFPHYYAAALPALSTPSTGNIEWSTVMYSNVLYCTVMYSTVQSALQKSVPPATRRFRKYETGQEVLPALLTVSAHTRKYQIFPDIYSISIFF